MVALIAINQTNRPYTWGPSSNGPKLTKFKRLKKKSMRVSNRLLVHFWKLIEKNLEMEIYIIFINITSHISLVSSHVTLKVLHKDAGISS